ncbi:hypothetical protein WN55_01460 [Dufourea novaeangliae]|uniref:Uncharacterized protein n=1 Tax=Dufourea novaeangliae TaxID=178035 RepID=A0A154PFY1_DUFNO|nr:hypothetical protein WN55_01460 [Dufourea novaeangliae]
MLHLFEYFRVFCVYMTGGVVANVSRTNLSYSIATRSRTHELECPPMGNFTARRDTRSKREKLTDDRTYNDVERKKETDK